MRTTPGQHLLKAVTPLGRVDRVRRLRAAAVVAAAEGGLDELLTELDAAGGTAREVAVDLAVVAGHRTFLLYALTLDLPLAARAWVQVVRMNLLDGDGIGRRLIDLPTAGRRHVHRLLRRYGTPVAVDRVLPVVARRFGADEAASLLSACSGEVVVEWWAELDHAAINWKILGRHHPELVLDHFRQRLARTPRGSRAAQWVPWLRALPALAAAAPGRVLDLLEAGQGEYEPGAVGSAVWAMLARFDPSRTAALLLHPRNRAPLPSGRPLWRALRELEDAALIELAHRIGGHRLPEMLTVLPAPRRSRIFAGFIGDRDLGAAGLSFAVLDLLPAEDRAAQAVRLLGRGRAADDPAVLLQLTARLPWAESAPALRAATTRPLAADRVTGYRLLIEAAAATRDPVVITEMLQSLSRLTNEQDPVRQPVLAAIGRIPASRWNADGVTAVGRIAAEALQARDASWATRVNVQAVVGRLMTQGAVTRNDHQLATATALWDLLGQQYRSVPFPDLLRSLPAGAEFGVYEALRGRIERDAKRGRFDLVVDLDTALGRRAWPISGLQEMLHQALTAKDDGIVSRAVGLWLADPATRSNRVAEVLRTDPSTIVLDPVRAAVGSRRPDLLTSILDRGAAGRFLPPGVSFVPIFGGVVRQWSPPQQEAYRASLKRALARSGLPLWERIRVVRQLAAVPGTLPVLQKVSQDEEVTLAEAALAAMARTEDPREALPTLLAQSGGPRARVAVYATTRAARSLRPGELLPALTPLLQGPKVTARKEAVRILGENRAPDLSGLLTAVWDAPDQHRDVRRAVVSAARGAMADERTWGLLDRAARDAAVATALAGIRPEQLAEPYRGRFAALIGVVARSSEPATRLEALTALRFWGRWDDGSNSDLLAERVVDLADTATWRTALMSLAATSAATDDLSAVVGVVDTLMAHADPVEPTSERDQPALQRIIAVSEVVRAQLSRSPALGPAARDLARLLAVAEPLRPSAVELACAAVDWPAPAETLVAQLITVGAVAGGQGGTAAAALLLEQSLVDAVNRAICPALLGAAQELTGADGVGAGRFALVIVGVVGEELGWSTDWVDLLVRLRCHADPQTKVAAVTTFVHRE